MLCENANMRPYLMIYDFAFADDGVKELYKGIGNDDLQCHYGTSIETLILIRSFTLFDFVSSKTRSSKKILQS